MAAVSMYPIYYQYRSIDKLYIIKVKQDQSITLKVLDVFKKCFFKPRFSKEALQRKISWISSWVKSSWVTVIIIFSGLRCMVKVNLKT